MDVVSWTVNDRPTMEWLVGIGVDGLITDRPGLLRDVLADVPSGLRTIAKAIEPMAEPSEPSGLAPKEKNFAAWQTTGKGMRFTFEDYQLGGRGVRTYTVPWRTVRPLLSDRGTGLLDPDVDPSTC